MSNNVSRIENALEAFDAVERARHTGNPITPELQQSVSQALAEVKTLSRADQIAAIESLDDTKKSKSLGVLALNLGLTANDLHSVGAHAYGGGADAAGDAPRVSAGALHDPRRMQEIGARFDAARRGAAASSQSVDAAVTNEIRLSLEEIRADVEETKASSAHYAQLIDSTYQPESRVKGVEASIEHTRELLSKKRGTLASMEKRLDENDPEAKPTLDALRAEIAELEKEIPKLEAVMATADQLDQGYSAHREQMIGVMGDTRLDDYILAGLDRIQTDGEVPVGFAALLERRYGDYEAFVRGLKPDRKAELERFLSREPQMVRAYLETGSPTPEFAQVVQTVEGFDEQAPNEDLGRALAKAAGKETTPPENRDAAIAREYRDSFEALHANDAKKHYEVLWALAKSPDDFDRKATELQWSPSEREDYRAKASQILDRELQGVNGETFEVRDAFSFHNLLKDSQLLMPGRRAGGVNEGERNEAELRMSVRIWAAQNLRGRTMDDATFTEKVRAKATNLRAKSSTERSQIREAYGIRDMKPKRGNLSPEKEEILNRHPDFKLAYEQYRRKEEQYEQMSATTLTQISSLLNSGMPIDKLIVAVMFLMTMREEEKFKRMLAEVGVIEQIERTNADIQEKREALAQHNDQQKNEPTKDSDLSLAEVKEYEKLEFINPVDFGFSAKSHHMLTQELQASLQFFQQMMQALSQSLSVWQGLVDSILSRWR